jgi:hypothetical protein
VQHEHLRGGQRTIVAAIDANVAVHAASFPALVLP